MDVLQQLTDLRSELNQHNYNYYVLDNPTISDFDFDQKLKQLQELEVKYPEYFDENSPSVRVGGAITKNFETVVHQNRMYSLENSYSRQDLLDWEQRLQRVLGNVPLQYVCELKYDGASISITYEAERVVLNSMQRMSAIATKTHQYTKLIEGTKAKILDTRKTTPGIRAIEKWAVKIGGGENHRFALYDMIMLKDNHIDFAGGITQAITQTQRYLVVQKKDLKIVVEARNLKEIEEILANEGVYQILIDNFNYEDTVAAVKLINGKCFAESSGNINETTLAAYANCGVDYISSGALTHSVYNLDLSLKAVL